MLAIAGAKGGCGKTTVTLGLATALANDGTPAIAVDADRQLPDLHTMADVERDPTIAALDGKTDVATVTKEVQGAPGVGVITAQYPEDTIDLTATLEQLDYDSAEIVIDSPSGAGPDVVDPISAAEQVVIVTTGTDRSVSAAQTTIDIAESLGVPIAGVVFNRCETVPESLASDLGVETLGAIPERETPLENEDVREAFAELAATLTAETNLTADRSVPQRPDRLLTGSDELDRLLDGGVHPGTVVALDAPPASQAELLLQNVTTKRGTLYLSTERSEDTVRDGFERSPVKTGTPTIRHLDGGAPLGEARKLIEKLPDSATLVIDAVDPLEANGRTEYVKFLNDVKEQTMVTEGIAVLHCLETPIESSNRSLTHQFADAVFEYHIEAEEDTLELKKFRSERNPERFEPVSFKEAVPLELGAGLDDQST